ERLIYGLDDRITIVTVLGGDGSAAAPSYYHRAGDEGSRPSVGAAALATHAERLPLAEALARGQAASLPYRSGDGAVRIAFVAATEPTVAAKGAPAAKGSIARGAMAAGGIAPGAARQAIAVEVAIDALVAAVAPGVALLDERGHVMM